MRSSRRPTPGRDAHQSSARRSDDGRGPRWSTSERCARGRVTPSRATPSSTGPSSAFSTSSVVSERNAVAALDVSTLADLGEAAERALHVLCDWRAASVTNRMKGHDSDVESALAELCARGVEVAAEAERDPSRRDVRHRRPGDPGRSRTRRRRIHVVVDGPPPFPPTIPTPMRRHPPASAAAAAERDRGGPRDPRARGAVDGGRRGPAAYPRAESGASRRTRLRAPLRGCGARPRRRGEKEARRRRS